MGHIVRLVNGHMVYDGLLSSQEKASIDDILHALQEEIPTIETDLEAEYGQGVWYKYNLGLFLGSLLEKYDISILNEALLGRNQTLCYKKKIAKEMKEQML